ncbi:hypothetical protein D3981_004348 [Escherichia coli]|nr:hypothetical protein [Escherichia coli]
MGSLPVWVMTLEGFYLVALVVHRYSSSVALVKQTEHNAKYNHSKNNRQNLADPRRA